MGKILLVLFLVVGAVAFFTRPDDKTCIIEGVKTVWGDMTPDPKDKPDFFEQFMNIHSKNVVVKDRIVFKQIDYKLQNGEKTVAIGAFNNVFPRVEPIQQTKYIPKMR